MTDLFKAFGGYNEFEKTSYFTLRFNALPSELRLDIPMDEKKQNMENVLQTINPENTGFEVMCKNWDTKNELGANPDDDYPYFYLFKNEQLRTILELSLNNNTLTAIFLYDSKDLKTERWILEANHKLRSKFGEEKTPTFKVLAKSNDFYTEDVKTENVSIDAQKHYNDDFEKVNDTISESLSTNNAGLILLHGTPGTGKTTYIRHLISKFTKNTFIFIQNEFVNELLHPTFISFLLTHRNAVLIIEDAEKVITSREQTNENSVVSTILQLTDGLFSDYLNIKVICTFNTSIDKIDKALLRKGRMIAYYDFKPLTKLKTKILMESLGQEDPNSELSLAEIFNYNSDNFNETKTAKTIGF
ncbi:hypothetical protein FUAX_18230 [Fulvitalea axinellae]|uniref:ATPase AAA-type core domain-containing protein n=1 Tax=Fulvitalea axinellae TaxID=1182444 RepID=A0AAU9CKB9_9BACT|nr:hypothetical protein FUAX_18230 [Fulvitalea axinellae]